MINFFFCKKLKKALWTISIILYFYLSTSAYSNPVQDLARISERIIDNSVQISVINKYIKTLKVSYKHKQQKLLSKRFQFATSVGLLYRFRFKPKELLLVQNLNINQLLHAYTVINYWSNNATQKIYHTYIELENIQTVAKKLNLAKQQLRRLNYGLAKTKYKLKKLVAENNFNYKNIQQVNKIRNNLAYSTAMLQKYQRLFFNIDKPVITKSEIIMNNEFVKSFRHKMQQPVKGYIYSNYMSTKNYNYTYYGIVFVGLSNSYITSPASGEVMYIGKLPKYNNLIIIKHSPSFISILGGNFIPKVKLANKVNKGQILGTINKTTPIYFEIDKNNKPVNPTGWLKQINKQ